MKKLSIISNQIKNNTYSYTGKGSFEAVVNQNKDIILEWLEDLIPLQKQIDMLKDLTDLEFQKRNYTRILTKLFPDEYTEFVSLNILVRDAHVIAQYYNEEYNVTILYNNLIENKFLKYPGKYDKYVSYNIFQKFVMMYREDLMKSLEKDEVKEYQQTSPNDDFSNENNEINNQEEPTEEELIEIDELVEVEVEVEQVVAQPKETNWTNLLLGRLK